MMNLFVKIRGWFSTKENIYELLLLAFFFAFSFFFRSLALTQTPYGNGWDGYFYLEQLQSLIETGKFHSPDASLIYPFLKAVYYFSGDYVLTLKIVSSLLAGFFSVSIYLLSKKLSEKKEIAVLIGLFTVFSPALTFFTSQFPKNLMGLVFFNFMALALISKKMIPAVLFLILAFITHRFTAGISILFLFSYVLLFSGVMKKYRWFFIGLIALAPISLFLPGTLHFADLERLKEIFSSVPQFAPVSFFNLLGFNKFDFFWFFEFIVLFSFYLVNLIFIIKTKSVLRETKKIYFIFFGLFFLLIFPLFIFDLNGPAYRFFFAFLLLCPLVLSPLFVKVHKKLLWGFSLIFFVLSFFSYHSYKPSVFDPPYSYYSSIIQKMTSILKNKETELIIAHKGIAEMSTFITGRDTMAWSPESSYNKKKVWRLAADIRVQDFEQTVLKEEMEFIIPVTLKYILIREDVWEKFCLKVKNSENEELKTILFSWKNPSQIRPNYLMNKR